LSLAAFPFQISYGASDDRLGGFYLPALERSERFDRTTGFFSSAALAIAAAGVVRLIRNGGRMRLLCGAQLSPQDVEAVRKGADLGVVVGDAMAGCLADPTDQSMKARLEALAWMVGAGKLEIRVVLPKGPDGLPRPAAQAREYYHPKEGVFVDAGGNKLAFSGSSNDSEDGWQWNYEVFQTFASFDRTIGADVVPHGRYYIVGIEGRFERLWAGKEEDWIALDIPEAARKKLLKLRPDAAPIRDPLEKLPPKKLPPQPEAPDAELAERVLFRFLREAPFLPNAGRLGIATSTVRPWPHQTRVVDETVARYPESFLFCDEVGLGKTIEAGLALRQLLVSGRVRRVLLLVPKSVLRQWQEELYEKFALNVPRHDGGEVLDVFGRALPIASSVWAGFPVLLASSQLAKRRERQEEVVSAPPWDLVIVDEAHHARRKDFLTDQYRPNRLMELLAGTGGRPGLRDRTRCLYLLTATPMQVHPVEVWDLLRVVGLGGRWGALQENFLGYFEQLRRPFENRDWDFLLDMVRDFLDSGGLLDRGFCDAAEKRVGYVDWATIEGLPRAHRRTAVVAQLDEQGRAVLEELVRRHTPLRRFVWRNTPPLLRRYKAMGLLDANVPERRPENVWIDLKAGAGNEEDLYGRIEEYISDFYEKYESERKGLGFIMTVYRRRLTSSFQAIRKSLERRRDFLKGIAPTHWLTDDDVEQDELDLDVTEGFVADERGRFLGELAYIDDFLRALGKLGTDSKLERLHDDLRSVFAERDTVLVFTQYTDTMDYLREELRHVYGGLVACYSGRGGERWDGAAWVPWGKEALKDAFRKGEDVKILLCTESASEGLNLQTCGVLVNYDMPWNPMRAEQRIGRIDRIGQRYTEVWVRNYFYQGTVEATIYQRLEDRIDWFETVVGELQPILHRVARVIQSVAMAKGSERIRRLEEEVAALRREIDEHNLQTISLEEHVDDQLASEAEEPVPVTLQALEKALVTSTRLEGAFRPHPDIPGAHLLSRSGGERAVTFSPEVFDRHPYSVELLTYGVPLLDELLREVSDPPPPRGPSGIGFFKGESPTPVGVFVATDGHDVSLVRDVCGVREAVEADPTPWTESSERAALQLYRQAARTTREQVGRAWDSRHASERLALVEGARQLAIRAALIEVARAQHTELFETVVPVGFGTDPVAGLKRHGVPFKPLLAIADEPGLSADASHPFWGVIQGEGRDAIQRRWEAVRRQATDLIEKYAAWRRAERPDGAEGNVDEMPTRTWLPTRLAGARTSTAEASSGKLLPFRVVAHRDVQPFRNAVPVYRTLQAAAGGFGPNRVVDGVPNVGAFDVEAYEWAAPCGRTSAGRGLFIAQVVGESMNRRIPNGAWCLWRACAGTPERGRVVLAEHRGTTDAETGAEYTVKLFDFETREVERGGPECVRVALRPDSSDEGFRPLTFDASDGEALRIIAEFVEVLG